MRIYRTSIAVGCLLLLVIACGKVESQNNSPVDELKTVMRKLEATLNNQKPVISAPKPGDPYYTEWWVRQIYTNPSMEFDVQKTDSLVSPFKGVVNFECNFRSAKGDSKEAVQGELRNFMTNKCRSTFSYQEKRWVFKSLSCSKDPLQPSHFQEINAGDPSIFGQCRDIASAAAP